MSAFATATEEEVSAAGQVPGGALFVSVKNIGEQVGSVNGVPLDPGEAKSYPFIGKPYMNFHYDPQGSRLRILYVI